MIKLVVLLLIVLFGTPAFAFEIEPQVKLTSINFEERGISEGNKFMTGVAFSVSGGDNWQWSVTPELWQMAEPADEDPEIPDQGVIINAQLGRKFTLLGIDVVPVAGVYAGRWERQGNDKYKGSWTYANFADVPFGVNLKSGIFYAKLNLLLPVFVQTDYVTSWAIKGPHEMLEVGIEYQGLTANVFRRRIGFDQLDSDIYLTGVGFGFKF